ncbi:ATP-binding protein [Nocardioides sp.]|uniref:sensor histidine kinase n=1 Tax=Nocardioides sp. TaxID=35761 RepID=UPI001A258880|nr:ATP-binding protein [Nocardioides sp.]MBJ7357240.1 hypothetical protein [Nocardioides sp.]
MSASRILSVAWVPVVALAVVLQATTDSALVADVVYLAVLVGASVAAWAGVSRSPRGRRLVPCLVATGITLNAIGDVLWTFLERAGTNTEVSVADLPWYGSYVFLCLAMWTVLTQSREGGRADLDFVVDAVTIVVISVLAFWTFSVEAIVSDTSVSPLVRAAWSAYPVLDAVLLALVLRLLWSRSARAVIDVWFGLGVGLWLVADVLYIHLPEDPTALVVMDAGWMVAPVLMARAAWRSYDAEPADVRREKAPMGWVPRMLLAVFPLVVPPGLELVGDLRGRDDQPLQLLIGTVVVMALALVRIGRLILSEQRAQRDLVEARDQALAASEAKSMFLANMSHEIRTPLTTVLVAAGLLKETPMSEVQQRFVEKVHRSGGQLQTLVEGLLDFSRIEAGHAVLDRAEFDLRAVVTDVVDAHLPRATRKGLTFDWEIDPRVPSTVVGDRQRVFQVLNNLVENAVKFTEEGRVGLSAAPLDDGGTAGGVQLAVTDTGIGIHDGDLASIFESFTQVDGTAARNYSGTGLGLAICKQVTELMGGTIEVRSELGVGTTFTVRLPLEALASDPAARALSS